MINMDTKESLDAILNPKSVAIVGASSDHMKWGWMLVNAIKVGGFQGQVYPINVRAAEIKEILGYPVYASVKDVPGLVDSAVIVVPARAVPSVFDDMVTKGVKGAVVITSGFSETGEEGAKAIADI